MTRDEILAMSNILCPNCGIPIIEHPANNCLNALVAEWVMGFCVHSWKFGETLVTDMCVVRICEKCGIEHYGLNPPLYANRYGSFSTDNGASMEMVEKIESMPNFWRTITEHVPATSDIAINKQEYSYVNFVFVWNDGNGTHMRDAKYSGNVTLFLARCRAALLAVKELE